MTTAICTIASLQAILTGITHKFVPNWLNASIIAAFIQLAITITIAVILTI